MENKTKEIKGTRKIGMIMYRYPLGVSPSLINSAILLAQENYEVHIFIDRDTFHKSKIDFKKEKIILHIIDFVWDKRILFSPLKYSSLVLKYVISKLFAKTILGRILLLPVKKNKYIFSTFVSRMYYRNLYEYAAIISKSITADYICLFGVEAFGLIVANIVSITKKISVVYYNLELLLEDECKTLNHKILKNLERSANRKSLFTIVQDRRRAKYLMQDNDIPEDRILYVPVSALGAEYREKGKYFRQKFNISKDKRIVLCAGNIIDWSMTFEIAEAALTWKSDKILVLHTWKKDSKDLYLKRVKNLVDWNKIYLSDTPVEWDELPNLLSSADIGLVFYKNYGENFYETGSSSNKLAQYLQVGLPVITSDFPSFREVIEQEGCGKCVSDPMEIEEQIDNIFDDYNLFRNNAFKCYRERYEFSKYFKEVLECIDRLQ